MADEPHGTIALSRKKYEKELARHITPGESFGNGQPGKRLLLAIPQRDRLERVLK